jgi:hypothetical protein
MTPERARRPERASYAAFAEHLARTSGFPTYLPWPLPPGWRIADFGARGTQERTHGSLVALEGLNPEDGGISMAVVAEEPGCGLGASVAGTVWTDPGADIGDRPADARVRVGASTVPLWTVSTHNASTDLDRSVLAGEADGRWLWLVIRPASAALMLRSPWRFCDATEIGPPLLAVPFGPPTAEW